jgi:hypothetical protein
MMIQRNSHNRLLTIVDRRTIRKANTKLNKNSNPWVPITNFVADPSDSEEDLPKQGSIGNARPITGLSRRTKASSPNASRSSYLKANGTSDASSTLNYGA